TLIMEVFSLMLARKVKENSISVIKEALMEFSNSSSLKPNMDKSVVFFGSVKEMVKQRILEVLPFKVGKLPVKYLGNGINVPMWTDNWSDVGWLKQFVTDKDIHEARMNTECSVADMIEDKE
ncbi:hypothetical protein Tco_1049612, partial [Tanacetum coccineum]